MLNDQAANLRRTLKQSEKQTTTKTISIVSGKGGVGKSNVALNFALELLAKEKKVLLFDLDVGMGNIDILLGLQAKYTIFDMLRQRLSIQDIIERGPKELSYIAGGSGINQLFSMSKNDANYFLNEYEKLEHMYDFIIFDLGAGVSYESMVFIQASDECFVVTTPEPTSITDAYAMIKHIVNVKPKMSIYIVMNRSSTTKSGQNAMEKFQHVIRHFLNIDVHPLGILPDDQLVSTAVIRQKPIILLNKRASISRAIQQMTDYYLHLLGESDKKSSRSFMQKLKQLFKERAIL